MQNRNIKLLYVLSIFFSFLIFLFLTISFDKSHAQTRTLKSESAEVVNVARPDDFYLKFPVQNRTAASVLINSVLDHSNVFLHTSNPYRADGKIIAYTGETGEYGCILVLSSLCQKRNLYGTNFVLNGSVGSPQDYLAYDGHPGFDFKSTDQAPYLPRMLAAESGTLTCYNDGLNTADIDHSYGYRTRYLHMRSRICQTGSVQVSAGQEIGTISNVGTVGAHAHFEVHKSVGGGQWRKVDPYGWQGQYRDPQGDGTSTNLWKPVASTANRPTRWHPDGTLIRDVTDSNGTIYLLRNRKKLGIPSLDTFYRYGFDFSNVIKISHEEFNCIPSGGILGNPPSQRLIKDNGIVYEITDQGYKRAFSSNAAFEGQGFRYSDVSNGSVAGVPDDPKVPVYSSRFRDGTLIGEIDNSVSRRVKPNTPIYVISNGVKRAFETASAFQNLGYRFDDVQTIDSGTINSIGSGPTIRDTLVQACGQAPPVQNDTFSPSNILRSILDIFFLKSNSSTFVVNTDIVTLTGIATDAESGDSGISSIRINGVRAANDTTNGNGVINWSKEIQLVPGENEIVVSVIDNSPNRNQSQQVITIDYEPPNTDNYDPLLYVSSPESGTVLDSQIVTVTGEATDGGSGNNGISRVTVNGVQASNSTVSGSDVAYWSAEINLQLGDNSITVVATDNSANQNSTTQTFHVEVVLPGQNTNPLDYAWSTRNPIPSGREGSSVVVLDGKIHVMGGSPDARRHDRYDPNTNQWENLPDIPELGFYSGSAVVWNGKIYAYSSIFGRPFDPRDEFLKIFDPINNSWSLGAELPLERGRGTSLVVSQNRLFAIGGTNRFLQGGNEEVYEYDTNNDQWIARAPLPRPRGFSVVHSARGRIYVMGGISSQFGASTNFVDIYDPFTDTWSIGNPAPYNFWAASSALIEGGRRPFTGSYRVIIMGGFDDDFNRMPFVFEHNYDTGEWRQLSSLPNSISKAVGTIVSRNLYFIGGEDSDGNVLTSTYKGTPVDWAPSLTITPASNEIDTDINSELFVRLGSPPDSNVTVSLSSSNTDILTIQPQIIFGPGETLKTVPIQSSPINTGQITLTGQLPVSMGGEISSANMEVIARLPSIFHNPVSEITSTSAVLSGSVNPNSSDTNTWFEWSLNSDLSDGHSAGYQNVGFGNTPVQVFTSLENLTPNTTYYYRHAAANGGGWRRDEQPIHSFTTTSQSSQNADFDFDGDNKTDISIFRPNLGEWWYLKSSDGTSRAFQFGSSADKIVPADFTGDGKTDIAFWRESSGQWFVLRSENSSFYSFPFGTIGDIPAPADYDGDGTDDPAVFRPSNATWYIINSSGGTTILSFGVAEDKPVVADYDGDGKDDIAIFRPSVSEWWILKSSGGAVAFQFGEIGDKTVSADYTGDGKADIAIWRPTNRNWYILRSEDLSFYAFPFGANDDIPTPGDYDGDGRADAAVWRESNKTWFLQQTTAGFQAVAFGANGDIPVPNAYVVSSTNSLKLGMTESMLLFDFLPIAPNQSPFWNKAK